MLERSWLGDRWSGSSRMREHRSWSPGIPSAPRRPPTDHASFGRRLAASLIDSVLSIVIVGVLFAALFVGAGLEEGVAPPLWALFGFLAIMGVLVVGQVLYYAGFQAGVHGATIGKWLLGTEVIDTTTDGRLPIGRSLGRSALYVYGSSQFFGIGCLWMLWDDEKRTLHDLALNSHVVRRRSPRPSLGSLLRSFTLRR